MKTQMIKILLISLTIANSCFADDSVLLKKDTPAPFTGILMTPAKSKTIKNQLLERDELLQEKDSFEKSLKLYSDIEQLDAQKVNLLTSENDRLTKQLEQSKSTSNFERIIYFSLGILATSAVLYSVKHL